MQNIKEKKTRRKAIILSISEYDKLPVISVSKKNGEEMYTVLKSLGYEIEECYKLIGKVSWITLKNAIINFFSDMNIGPRDTLLFYFCGHGIPAHNGVYKLPSLTKRSEFHLDSDI